MQTKRPYLFSVVLTSTVYLFGCSSSDTKKPDPEHPICVATFNAYASEGLAHQSIGQPVDSAFHDSDGCGISQSPVGLPRVRSNGLPPVSIPPRSQTLVPFATSSVTAPTRVKLATLLLSATGEEPAFEAARAALDRLGIPYTTLITTEEALVEEALFEADGTCRFRGVILSESSLSYFDDATQQWLSSLSEQEWNTLDDYESRCDAREVIWYAWPSPEIGLDFVAEFQSDEAVPTRLTVAGEDVFSYVQPDAQITIYDAWGYRARVLDATTTVPLVVTEEGDVVSVVHTRPDGREVLAMTMDSSEYSLHASVLGYGVLRWLHRDVFVGVRRTYLSAHIDDLFLSTEMWVPDRKDDAIVQYRIGGQDLERLVQWEKQLRAKLPTGSNFVTTMAFNGEGATRSAEFEPSLMDAFDIHKDEFLWLNHTWDHTNMDEMSEMDAQAEMVQNCELADALQMRGFSCASAVTPQISGLDNPNAVSGMLLAGVKYVVSDTSVTAVLNPGNPGTNPSHNVGNLNPIDPELYQVPRYPTNIFFNCSVPEEEVDLYNHLYAEEFGCALTYPQILQQDTNLALHYLLTYDANPLMFHQANLRFWQESDGSWHSLYTDWVDTAISRFLELVQLPIVSLTLEENGILMEERKALAGCAPTATLVMEGEQYHIELNTIDTCVVPLTGVDSESSGFVEYYGGEPTTFVDVAPNETWTIPL